MLKKYIVLSSMVIMMLGTMTLFAQKVAYTSYQLNHPIKLKAEKVFFKPLINMGDKTNIDVNGHMEEVLELMFKPIEQSTNPFAWVTKPWFIKSSNENEASVVVSGSYNIKAITEIEQHQFYEKSSALANPIPYFEVRPKNTVEAIVIISYQYADKTMEFDTIRFNKVSERVAGKKMKSLQSLVESCEKSIQYQIKKCFSLVDYEEAKYQLQKVKISDKGLKEEWKQSGDLLKNHEIMKLGDLCKRIYESKPSKEAAFNLGICYERVGNYPKATAYYKQMPDFHTIARMKKQLALFNYLHEIGVKTELVEF